VAVQRLVEIAMGRAACVNTPFATATILDLLPHTRALCNQDAWGESVIRAGRRQSIARP
jgi:hypothetical protein